MRRPSRHLRAFSLVEVVLALGIVSFAIVTAVGLTLAGFNGFQRAINTTTETEIAQNVVNQLQEISYTNIPSACSTNYYFTQEGLPTNAASALYTVAMTTPTNFALPNTGSPTPSTNLLMIILNITSENAPFSTNAIQVYIANTGS